LKTAGRKKSKDELDVMMNTRGYKATFIRHASTTTSRTLIIVE